MQKYEDMLTNIYTALPEKLKEKSRFKMPEFEVFIQGNQTIINNYLDVVTTLRREPKHLLKFLEKRLAAVGSIEKARAILNGKFRGNQINERLNEYANEFVLCRECKKPDTEMVTIEGVQYLRCEACGARSPVQNIRY